MGEIRKYTCSCGYGKELFIGAGLQGININMIAGHFPEEIVQTFLDQKKRGEVASYLLENALVSCPDCRELETVPCFHYELEDGVKRSFVKPCPGCGRTIERAQHPDSVKCPRCGNKMEYIMTGSWD